MDKKQVIAAFKKRPSARIDKTKLSYDKAEWHADDVRKLGLNPLLAYLPGGMLFAWAVERKLIAAALEKEHQNVIERFEQENSSPALLFKEIGGVLRPEQFTSVAEEFLRSYYREHYISDYLKAVQPRTNDYDVEDSYENYRKVKQQLDLRFENFLQERSRSAKVDEQGRTERNASLLVNEKLSVYVILGSPKEKSPWIWTEWKRFANILDPLLQKSRGKTHIQTSQLDGKKFVQFGPLAWNQEGHEKWTLESPLTKTFSDRKFLSVEIANPSWPVCSREKTPPDVLFKISNEAMNHESLQFNPVVSIVLRDSLSQKLGQPIEKTIFALASSLNALMVVKAERPFAHQMQEGGLTHCMIDELNWNLFIQGNCQTEAPSLEILNKFWADWSAVDWKKWQKV